MAEGRAAEPVRSDGHFDGSTHIHGKVIEDVKGQSRSIEPNRRRNVLSGRARALVSGPSRHRLALAAVLILSAFLNLSWLSSEGYANSYYAAAVKNMLTSWHNFFFVSFDAGFVSVDKPPLGLWVQAASAYLFGFNGLSLLLPQAIAGVLSVALLYHLVRRTFGPIAGLLAALALAVTPISVAVQRNNVMDALLILVLLLAAWAFIVAAEKGSPGWLLIGAVVVGLGFNIKMMQAFLVLPALYLLYLLANRTTWRRRFLHLGAATFVLLAVSLSWAVAVDLTPSTERPYVGSSPDDSVLRLIVGYNGFDRLSGTSLGSGGEIMTAGSPGGPGSGSMELGDPGPLRLLNGQLAGQASWLLPLAVVSLLAAGWQRWLPLSLNHRQAGLVLWGTWLLTVAAYLSVASGGHRYYTVMLAPAVAALVGIGVSVLWKDYQNPGRRGWLLPLALVGMAAVQAYVLFDYPIWRAWLIPATLGLSLGAAGLLTASRLSRLRSQDVGRWASYPAVAVSVGVLALLIAPAAWTVHDVLSSEGGGGMGLPSAGPRSSQAFGPLGRGPGGGPPGGGPPGGGPGGPGGRSADPALVEYLQANKGDAEYLVVASNAMSASPLILNTDEPIVSLGGYNGVDPVFTADDLAKLVDGNAVRFFLMPDKELMAERASDRNNSSSQNSPPRGGPGPDGGLPENGSAEWVETNCEKVPQELWQSSTSEGGGGGPPGRARALYDCGVRGS
jgi:4-amino-4-deoxy-L-arabinose transferase-like glycosyltransferase